MRVISLPEMKPGERGVVRQVDRNAPLTDRLIEMGFIPGSVVQKICSDRTESISAYSVADTCVALRRKDASGVRVEAR